jgi:hypothetical protein
MSTPIVYGRGEGVVIATGMNTEIGRIAKMLSNNEDEDTPLQKKLAQLSKFLGYLTLGIVVVMFGVSLIYEGVNHDRHRLEQCPSGCRRPRRRRNSGRLARRRHHRFGLRHAEDDPGQYDRPAFGLG